MAGLVIVVNALLLLWALAVMPSTWTRRGRWSRLRRGNAEPIANLCLGTDRTGWTYVIAYHARNGR